jgi:glycine cleavage system protein P-like pyridoxal-binding family
MSANMGNAGVLMRAYVYARLLGREGMHRVAEYATLNANYLMAKLREAGFDLAYPNRRASHEFIVTLKKLKDATGVSAMDFAKRLLDYGYHAPTTYFPLLVPECLLIEPTETESRETLDGFIDAMISIRLEADQVAAGVWPAEDNPLVNAPHTAAHLTTSEWSHPYARELACYPAQFSRAQEAGVALAASPGVANKYWPPVRRIDQAFGDRNLVCACPPIDAFA